MKQYIAYIFLFIFSFQILPVKEIGRILYKGLLTEERSEAPACEDEAEIPKLKKEGDPFHYYSATLGLSKYISTRILTAIHISESIPQYHVPDIFTPPPNYC